MTRTHGPVRILGLSVAAVLACAAAGPAAESQGEHARISLEKAKAQIELALKQAELSLAPHQPGSGWTRQHMQRVLNVIEGRRGPDFRETVEDPGDGYGAVWHLRDALDALPGGLSTDAGTALDHALAYLNDAAEHARRSLKGTSVAQVHREAGLAAGMLAAALGREGSSAPAIGALTYGLNALGQAPAK
ncbi:MAG TPA: hypothetical protein VNK46_12985 [Nitrospiraceae bacterium]|jgi:hypothetical protein|nr:hypothetical protein [Nitrospiraceae bacterium]